jgi:hypothetical protein
LMHSMLGVSESSLSNVGNTSQIMREVRRPNHQRAQKDQP